MRRPRKLFMLGVLLLAAAPRVASAQSMADRIRRRAEEAAGRKVDQAVDKAVDCASGDAKCIDKAKSEGKPVNVKPPADSVKPASSAKPAASESATTVSTASATGAAGATGADALKPGEGAWANYDFKPGERVLYGDDFRKDEVGDFPHSMEFVSGSIETVDWQGGRWLRLQTTSKFAVPLPEVLPARFTMEFDIAVPAGELWIFPLGEQKGDKIIFSDGARAGLMVPNGPTATSEYDREMYGKMYRARVMADGKYMKLYVNDHRLANIPNTTGERSNKILFFADASAKLPALFGNFRIAAGGKKLYDAIAEKGRVATQGIYFDVGSDRIRPESTPTLKEISAMLTEHADLKLSIEGHTDNVGSAASNLSLSEKRAAAVVKYLVDAGGIASTRLSSKGLGASKPAASNDTPEGRQNNRRVELVKN